jgi:hypothetical protein
MPRRLSTAPVLEKRLSALVLAPFAGVDHRQPQGGVGVEEAAQLGGGEKVAVAASLIHQRNAPFALLRVKVAVADEVENVPLPGLERPVEVAPALPLHPDQLDCAGVQQVVDGFDHPLLFLRGVKRGQVGGAGDHSQNADRRRDSQRRSGAAHLQIAADWRLAQQVYVVAHVGVVEEFPGQLGQLWSFHPQAHPQTFALPASHFEATTIATTHFVVKKGFEECTAHFSGQGGFADIHRRGCGICYTPQICPHPTHLFQCFQRSHKRFVEGHL